MTFLIEQLEVARVSGYFARRLGGVVGQLHRRPAISGVSHLTAYSTDTAKTRDFYTRVLGAQEGADPENPAGKRYYFSPRQFVGKRPA